MFPNVHICKHGAGHQFASHHHLCPSHHTRICRTFGCHRGRLVYGCGFDLIHRVWTCAVVFFGMFMQRHVLESKRKLNHHPAVQGLSLSLSLSLSLYLSISLYLSLYLSISLSIYPIYLSILSISLSISLSSRRSTYSMPLTSLLNTKICSHSEQTDQMQSDLSISSLNVFVSCSSSRQCLCHHIIDKSCLSRYVTLITLMGQAVFGFYIYTLLAQLLATNPPTSQVSTCSLFYTSIYDYAMSFARMHIHTNFTILLSYSLLCMLSPFEMQQSSSLSLSLSLSFFLSFFLSGSD